MAALLGVVMVVLAHRRQTVSDAMLVPLGMFLDTAGLEGVRFTSVPASPSMTEDTCRAAIPVQLMGSTSRVNRTSRAASRAMSGVSRRGWPQQDR